LYTPTFTELAGSAEAFFTGHFGRAPLLRAAALRGQPADLLAVSDLDRLLALGAVPADRIGVLRAGVPVAAPAYADGERVVPERVYDLFRAGATITWTALERVRPNLRAMADGLAHAFAAPAGVRAVLTPAGRQPAAPGREEADQFVVQLSGGQDVRLTGGPTYSLRAGDVLYLPPGTSAATSAGDSVSLHLVAAVRPRTWAELLTELVSGIVAGDPAFAEVPRMDPRSRGEQARGLLRAVAMLEDRLADLDPVDEVTRLAARAAPVQAPTRFTEATRVDAADADSVFGLAPVHLTFGATINEHTELVVRGAGRDAVYPLPTQLVGMLRDLGADGTVRAAELFPGAEEAESVAMAKRLARMGILTQVH
jgi:hypothetical protein